LVEFAVAAFKLNCAFENALFKGGVELAQFLLGLFATDGMGDVAGNGL
jgi:hypothetical protein